MLNGTKKCILPTGFISIKSSCIRRLIHSYMANVEAKTSLNPTVSRPVFLTELITLSTKDSKIMGPRRPLKVCQKYLF